MKAGPLARALLAFAFLAFAPAIAPAQPTPGGPFGAEEAVRSWTLEVDSAEATLQRARLTHEELDTPRGRLVELRGRAQDMRDAAEAAAAASRKLLDVLGPAPAAGAPAELETVAVERRLLTGDISRNEGLARRADLQITRVQTMLDGIGLRRRTLLLQELLQRGDSPLDPQEWIGAANDLSARLAQRQAEWREWWNSSQRTELLPGALWRALLRATVVGAVIAGLGLYLRRRFGRAGRAVAPNYPARVLSAAADMVLFVGTPQAVVWAVYISLVNSGALSAQAAAAVYGWREALNALLIAFVGARIVLAPAAPGWRAVPLGNGSARRLARDVAAVFMILAFDAIAKPFLFGATRGFGDPDIRTVFEAILVTLAALALAMLARKGNWKPGGEISAVGGAPADTGGARVGRWFWVRTVWIAAALGALAAMPFGYARLSAFILYNLLYSAVIIAVIVLVQATMRELVRALTRRYGDEGRGELYGWWTLRLVNVGLGALAVLGVLPLWGVGWDEIGDFAWRAFFGLKVGGYTISLIHVFAAIAAFIGIRFVTRVVQRSFERTILPQTRIDPGVGNSIRAGIGYVGLLMAAVAGLGVIGLDLTNIALVAGALSVGIGFGLQNIVNNFVSGIILLVERPIKVGDWVVVGQNEGTIRRINVRATEIETFRRSTVIIPNAELLSSSVTNWTYKDRFGRVEVRIGVAWDSDVAAVEKLLLDCARSDPRILSDPAPHVLLYFGATALEFEVRGVLADASTMAFVASDLRKKILAALAAAGIAIPLPVTESRVRRPEAPAT